MTEERRQLMLDENANGYKLEQIESVEDNETGTAAENIYDIRLEKIKYFKYLGQD